MLADGVEGLLEPGGRFDVDGFDQFFELLFRIGQIGHLGGEEALAFDELFHFLDGVNVHAAEALDLLAKLLDLGGDRGPIQFRRWVGILRPAIDISRADRAASLRPLAR